MLITNEYLNLNAGLHATKRGFGKWGFRHAQSISFLIERLEVKSVLDYGCGKGTLGPQLQKQFPMLHVQNYDPAVKRFNKEPRPAELVICTDVLEHIEPQCLNDVLLHIHRLTIKAAWFVISTILDPKKLLPDGSNPHRLVAPAKDWVVHLSGLFRISELVEGVIPNTYSHPGEFRFLARPRGDGQ